MILDRPDRVPDAIEPLIGYRVWYFESDLHRASLFPLGRRGAAARSAWDGANHRWVSATCPRDTPEIRASVMRRLEWIRSMFGYDLPDPPPVPDPHATPGEDCSCGFYAMKELGSVEEPLEENVILGRVELAGKVIEHTAGYRAELARIAELIPIEGRERSTKRLAMHLGLPLTSAIPPWIVREGLDPVA